MRYFKRRRSPPDFYDANAQRFRIVQTHRVKRCGTCTYEIPEADIVVEDGQERCPMCKDTITAEWTANEEQHVAQVKMDSALLLNVPAQFSIRSLNEPVIGVVTSITDSAGNVLSQSSPLRMVRTVASTVKLIGRNFTTANVTTYATGITDNTAPVITPTLITLSLVASGAMATGSYGITMADGVTQTNHEFPYILAVR